MVKVYAKDAGVSEDNNIHFYTLEGHFAVLALFFCF